MKVRRIGGTQFALVHECKRKSEAREVAKEIRSGGYNARVIRSGKQWQTWREVV